MANYHVNEYTAVWVGGDYSINVATVYANSFADVAPAILNNTLIFLAREVRSVTYRRSIAVISDNASLTFPIVISTHLEDSRSGS